MSDSFGGAKSPLQPPPIGPSQTYNVDPAYYGQSLELAEKMLAKLATEAATTSSAKNNKAGGDLFFQFNDNRAGDEDRRDIEELQRGKEFEVQYIISETANKSREVRLVLSMHGIKVYEPANKKRARNFVIEQILQYSYNQHQGRFMFSYLELDGVLTNYRFQSKDYFEIHRSLGLAISLMIQKTSPAAPTVATETSLDDLRSQPTIVAAVPTVAAPSSELLQKQKKAKPRQEALLSSSSSSLPMQRQQSQQVVADTTPEMTSVNSSANSLPFSQPPPPAPPSSVADITAATANNNRPVLAEGSQLPIAQKYQQQMIAAKLRGSSSGSHVELTVNTSLAAQLAAQAQRPGSASTASDKSMKWALFSSGAGNASPAGLQSNSNNLRRIGSNIDSVGASKIHERGISADPGSSNLRSSFNHLIGKKFGSMPGLEKNSGHGHHQQPSSPLSADSDDTTSPARSFTLFRSSNRMADSGISSSSIDRQSDDEQHQQQPLVIKKCDRWGREVLIKNLSNGKYDINAGTIECLVDSLADENPPDSIYIELFLLTFRHFMKPVDLMTALHRRFESCASSIIRIRVTSVLKKWVERHFYDFRSAEAAEAFNVFLKTLRETECAKYVQQIIDILKAEFQREQEKNLPASIRANRDQLVDFQQLQAGVDLLLTWSPKRIAQELTLADLKLFRTIKPDEFCIFLWGDKKDPKLSNFNAYIDRFNRLGFWVSAIVCLQRTDIKRRAEILEKIMGVIKHCYRLQNFNTVMALMSGLNTTPVSRLKKTWDLTLKSRYIGIYREIEHKMSYQSNFKAYRELEGAAKPPFIPFFGLYVKDLTFMNDGNQKFLKLAQQQIKPLPITRRPAESSGKSAKPKTLNISFGDSGGEKFTMASSVMPSSNFPLFSVPIDGMPTVPELNGGDADTAETSHAEPEIFLDDEEDEEEEPPAGPPELVNFEKCRSIFNKIHAIRIYQQSMYTFEEDKDDLDDAPAKGSGFFSFSGSGNNIGATSDKELERYFAEPNGPPAITDESRLREMSFECEPSQRAKGATTSILPSPISPLISGNGNNAHSFVASTTASSTANQSATSTSQSTPATARHMGSMELSTAIPTVPVPAPAPISVPAKPAPGTYLTSSNARRVDSKEFAVANQAGRQSSDSLPIPATNYSTTPARSSPMAPRRTTLAAAEIEENSKSDNYYSPNVKTSSVNK